jgi:hypothetical protein
VPDSDLPSRGGGPTIVSFGVGARVERLPTMIVRHMSDGSRVDVRRRLRATRFGRADSQDRRTWQKQTFLPAKRRKLALRCRRRTTNLGTGPALSG